MPVLYFIHFRKEFMLQGEAFDFLKHIYANRRASAVFPRLQFKLPVKEGQEDLSYEEHFALLTPDERICVNAMAEMCEANFRMYQVKYEKLHRSPAAGLWAKKYLKKTQKKMSTPVLRDNTVYFSAENGEDARFDADAEELEAREINFRPQMAAELETMERI